MTYQRAADEDLHAEGAIWKQLTTSLDNPRPPGVRPWLKFYAQHASGLMSIALKNSSPAAIMALAQEYGIAADSWSTAPWQLGIRLVASHTALRWLRNALAGDNGIALMHDLVERLETEVWGRGQIALDQCDRTFELTTACTALSRATRLIPRTNFHKALQTSTAFGSSENLLAVHGKLIAQTVQLCCEHHRGAGLDDALTAILAEHPGMHATQPLTGMAAGSARVAGP